MAEIENSATLLPEDVIQKYQWLDACLQKLPGAQKEFQPAWQAYKYLLGGRMFAYTGIHDPTGRPILTIKLEPAYSDLLRQEYPDIVPGYYMNKVHWSTVYLDGEVPLEVITDMAAASHRNMLLSLSRKAQQEILGAAYCPKD